MRTTTRRFAVALAAAGLLVSMGCAKDETVSASSTTTPVTASSGGGSGTTEPDATDPGEDDQGGDEDKDKDKDTGSGEYAEACARIEELEGLEDEPEGGTDEVFLIMEEARDAGPDELADHWDTLIGVLEELNALGDSDEAMTRAFELYGDPEFIEAAAAIDDFAQEECGLDIDLDPSEESPGGLTDDTIDTETTDVDADPTSIDAVQTHLAFLFGSEDWYSVLEENVTWGSSGSDDVTWTISFGEDPTIAGMTPSDLLDVCDELAAYLDGNESGAVTIEFHGPDDAVIASRQPGEDCEAA